MNFKKMVEDAIDKKTGDPIPISIPINKLGIKNKGSIMKIGNFYADFYNDLIENWGYKCTETRFIKNELDQSAYAMLWDWVSYKPIDDFARIKIEFSVNAFRISGDTVMGLFGIKYFLELDYKLTWRKNNLTKTFLPIYLRTKYQNKLFDWAANYIDECNSVKEKLMSRLNMNVYD